MDKETRNSKVLKDFIKYCEKYPNQRFWQALRNWANVSYLCVADSHDGPEIDTFYWEGRNG
jgi:hypothetical protein